MGWNGVTANAGSGGATFAFDIFTEGATVYVMPYSAIAFGPEDGPYVKVTTTDRFPVAAAQNGTWSVEIASGTITLPAGAATDALQEAANALLELLNGKIPELGQALEAASVPVVLTAAQLTTLTPPAAITGFATATNQNTGNALLAAIATSSGVMDDWDDGSDRCRVVGAAAENAPASGNPVLIGGRYDLLPRTLGIGDVGTIALDADGAVHISDGGNIITVAGADQVGSDGLSASGDAVPAAAYGLLYNGDTWDRLRGDAANGMLVNLGTNNDITGSVTANAGTNLNTSALALEAGGNLDEAVALLTIITADTGNIATAAAAIQTAVEILDNFVSGNEAQVDIVAPLPAGTNAIGKLAANSGVIVGAIEIAAAQTLAAVTTVSTVTAVTSITNALPAGTNVIGKIDHTTTGLGHGFKTVTAAGTDEAIAATTACKWVLIQAYRTNTGYIAVGGTGVDAATTGVELSPGQSLTLMVDDLADVCIDSTVNGEGVRFTYGT